MYSRKMDDNMRTISMLGDVWRLGSPIENYSDVTKNLEIEQQNHMYRM